MSLPLSKNTVKVLKLLAFSIFFPLGASVAWGAVSTAGVAESSELRSSVKSLSQLDVEALSTDVSVLPATQEQQTTSVLLAKTRKKARSNSRGGGNERIMTREKVLKSKDSTNLDFEAADISGAQKTPLGTVITQNKSDKDYDFVRLRRRWTPEMVNSAKSLDVGQGR